MEEELETAEPLFQFEPTADNTVEEELGIYFKRFPKEKQDQIQALVNYATLMGLDGKDLVSIGGKLDRIKAKRTIATNREIVSSMQIDTIGKDGNCWERWSYKHHDGTLYYFSSANWYDVTVKNTKTGKKTDPVIVEHYDLGRWSFKGNRYDLANVMLNVYHGHIILP